MPGSVSSEVVSCESFPVKEGSKQKRKLKEQSSHNNNLDCSPAKWTRSLSSCVIGGRALRKRNVTNISKGTLATSNTRRKLRTEKHNSPKNSKQEKKSFEIPLKKTIQKPKKSFKVVTEDASIIGHLNDKDLDTVAKVVKVKNYALRQSDRCKGEPQKQKNCSTSASKQFERLSFEPVRVKVKAEELNLLQLHSTPTDPSKGFRQPLTSDSVASFTTPTVKVILKNLSPNGLKKTALAVKKTTAKSVARKQKSEKASSLSVPIFTEINVKHFQGYVQICICPKRERYVKVNSLSLDGCGKSVRRKADGADRLPSHFNPINSDMLEELCVALENAQDSNCKAILLRSVGKVFCSGLDLQYILHHAKQGHRSELFSLLDGLRKFVNCLIHFPIPIIAAIQGPAVGLGAAMLCLCDIVLSSEDACFHLPYPQQGLTPDGCSTFLLPHVVGQSVANSLLYGNKTLSALEAFKCGLFSEVLPRETFMRHVIPRMRDICSSSSLALQTTKRMLRSNQLQQLVFANECENRALRRCLSSPECLKTMATYVRQYMT